MCVTPSYFLSSSRARSTALLPRTPVRSSTATSSASESAPAPLASSRSRGRSLSSQLEIPIGGGFLVSLKMHNGCHAMALTGKKLLLGLTGGIAAYKAAEFARLLVRRGADVRVTMTDAATRFITPTTMQALSGQPVWSDLWDARVPDAMGHIELSRDRELIAVAPASADFIAKVANGLADDLLSGRCLAGRSPPSIAPRLNEKLWQNPAPAPTIPRLREDGALVGGPAVGDQA